jgi:hypothetical protein
MKRIEEQPVKATIAAVALVAVTKEMAKPKSG